MIENNYSKKENINFPLLSIINRIFKKSSWLDVLEKDKESVFKNSLYAGEIVFEQFSGYNNIENKTVLDFGCGAGVKTVYYGTKGPKIVYGADTNIEQTTAAKKYSQNNNLNIQFMKINGQYMIPIETDSVDTVISSSVIEHIPNLKASLKEIRRILKPEGVFLNRWHPFRTRYGCHLNDAIGIPFLHLALKEEAMIRFYVSELKKKYGEIPKIFSQLNSSATRFVDLNFALNFMAIKEVDMAYREAEFKLIKQRYYLGKWEVKFPKCIPIKYRETFFDYQVDILS